MLSRRFFVRSAVLVPLGLAGCAGENAPAGGGSGGEQTVPPELAEPIDEPGTRSTLGRDVLRTDSTGGKPGGLVDIAVGKTGEGGTIQFPYAVTVSKGEQHRILLSFNTNSDTLAVRESFRSLISRDEGRSWRELSVGIPFSSVFHDGAGGIKAFNLRTYPTGRATERRVVFWSSSDFGESWVASQGVLTSSFPMSSVYFHRSVVPTTDGTGLLAVVYGKREGRNQDETWLVRSADRGQTWRVLSTVASLQEFGWSGSSTKREGFNEPTLARLPDGRIMVVVRQSAPVTPQVCRGRKQGLELVSRISADEGKTWSAPDQIMPADASGYQSADPQLLIVGKEVFLASGRPRTTLMKLDVTSEVPQWNQVYSYAPLVTSGYTSVVHVGGKKFVEFGDYGSNWCFAKGQQPAKIGIWMRPFSA